MGWLYYNFAIYFLILSSWAICNSLLYAECLSTFPICSFRIIPRSPEEELCGVQLLIYYLGKLSQRTFAQAVRVSLSSVITVICEKEYNTNLISFYFISEAELLINYSDHL